MDKADRKRLKQQGKELAERRSQEIRASLTAENPFPVGSPEWVARYKELHESPQQVATVQGTVVAERSFRFTLPGQWSRLPPSDDGTRWAYRSDDGEQLTVSLLGSSHPMSREEQMATLARVAVLRRKAEAEVPGAAGVVMTETGFGESGGVYAARFSGFESASQRRFNCMLLCGQSAVTTFY